MAISKFTPEELAELAAFDAEVDADDEISDEEIEIAEKRDTQAESWLRKLETIRYRERRNAYSRKYYQEHKAEIKAWKAQYYQEHKEEYRLRRKAWEAGNAAVYAKFGAMIRAERLDIGYSVVYAAASLGCSREDWYRMERGHKPFEWERVQAVLPGIGPKPKDFPQ